MTNLNRDTSYILLNIVPLFNVIPASPPCVWWTRRESFREDRKIPDKPE